MLDETDRNSSVESHSREFMQSFVYMTNADLNFVRQHEDKISLAKL